MKRDLPDFKALAAQSHKALGAQGVLRLFDAAQAWDLAPVLNAGGAIIFPHATIDVCGHQIAAAVRACLDCEADRVLVLGVLHALTQELQDARVRVANGEDPANFRHWGIQGPGLGGLQNWKHDHVLMSWRHLWNAEIRRRGIRGPEVIERYPYLAGGHPENLPGIEELQKIAVQPVGSASHQTGAAFARNRAAMGQGRYATVKIAEPIRIIQSTRSGQGPSASIIVRLVGLDSPT